LTKKELDKISAEKMVSNKKKTEGVDVAYLQKLSKRSEDYEKNRQDRINLANTENTFVP
jgi:hypothetical protein